jgi:transposase-like protein
MVLEAVHCPTCDGVEVVKYGKTAEGKQRYLCHNQECSCCTFILKHFYQGRLSQVKQQIVEMALNGSGIRDTARVLKVSPSTVIEQLKKVPTPAKG